MVYLCEICNFSSHIKTCLARHVQSKKHIRNKELAEKSVIKCNRCNYKFINQEQLDKHIENNKIFFDFPNKFKQRKCNDFECTLCHIKHYGYRAWQTHQVNCTGQSKFSSNLTLKTIKQRKDKFQQLKQHMVETGNTSYQVQINKLNETIGDTYPEDDYYHDYKFIKEEDWIIQEVDPDSRFFDKYQKERNKIYYKNKSFIIDLLHNAYDKENNIIGGFEELD